MTPSSAPAAARLLVDALTLLLFLTVLWWGLSLIRHRRPEDDPASGGEAVVSDHNAWRTTVLVGVAFSRIAAGFIGQAGTWPAGDARNGPEFLAFCWAVVVLVGPALVARGFWNGWRWHHGVPVASADRREASGGLAARLARVFWLAPDTRRRHPGLVTYSEIDVAAAVPLAGERVLWTGSARPISVAFWRFLPFSLAAVLIAPVIAAQSDFSAGWPSRPAYCILAALILIVPTAVYCVRASGGPWSIRYMLTDSRVVVVRPIAAVDYRYHACECRLADLPPARARVLPFGRGSVCFGSQWTPRYPGDGVFEGIIPVRPLMFLAISDPCRVADLVNEARAASQG